MDSAIGNFVPDDSAETNRPIRLGGSTLGTQRHICAFFDSHADQYRVLLPFIKDGFERGEKAVHIIDPRRREEHVRQLRSIGIDATAMQQVGQLDLHEWSDAHLRGRLFDPDRTRAVIDDIRQRSRQEGFTRIRFVTHMEWVAEVQVDVDTLLEYEARANVGLLADPVICVYDRAKFGDDLVIEVMRTRPMIIIGGIL
jgi:hypothetical protein